MQVGVGLWSMRSSVYDPASWASRYAELRADARHAEALGFDSLWLAEHHGWYDGWCPQPLVAAAAVLAATTRLRVGTAMFLLPQHGVDQTDRDAATLLSAFGPRLDLGAGLGYRDEEYDAVGVPRSSRGRVMREYLDTLLGRHGEAWAGGARLWVGGLAEPAIRRAGALGLSLLLPNTTRPEQVRSRAAVLAEAAGEAGVPCGAVGMLVDTWITSGEPGAEERALDRIVRHNREYAGAWFRLDGQAGFERPELLDAQSARTRSLAVVGAVPEVAGRLAVLRDSGLDLLVLNVRFDFPAAQHRDVMTELAASVLPGLRTASAA